MVIYGCHALDSEPPHHREARSINYGKVLVTVSEPNLPSSFQIGYADRFYCGRSVSYAFPKSLGGVALDSVPEQRPRLHQHMIGGEQRLTGLKDALARALLPSEESAAAYQIDVSTNRLMAAES